MEINTCSFNHLLKEDILNELGLSLSSAIDLYLMQIIKEKGITFEIKLPKEEEVEKRLK